MRVLRRTQEAAMLPVLLLVLAAVLLRADAAAAGSTVLDEATIMHRLRRLANDAGNLLAQGRCRQPPPCRQAMGATELLGVVHGLAATRAPAPLQGWWSGRRESGQAGAQTTLSTTAHGTASHVTQASA